ncbi:MAG: class I SAM-dependent methyltransferase [Deltaproteobacteria bacterium]|nr:class I SAM-dependent methyltransferase [Deltaproteobacteria bacterium]
MSDHPKAAGKSSFDLIEQGLFLDTIKTLGLSRVLDLGCGAGNYTVALAQLLGPDSQIYGVDLWEEGIRQLQARAQEAGLRNLEALVGDAGQHIPLEDQAVDLVFLGTVFHDFVEAGFHPTTLAEIKRVLTPAGCLAAVEFKKIDGPPGPPKAIRLSPPELAEMLGSHGFSQFEHLDLGPFTYLSIFRLATA